ncbi:MAG: hypothetical protein ACOC28_02675 [Alkalispirochaetaceae bacterium]
MKKLLLFAGVTLILISAPGALFSQEVGGGVSLFLPWSTFDHQEGSVSVETALETSLGIGPIISLPLGISYNQVWGLTPRGEDRNGEDIEVSAPWFYADAIAPYLMVQARIPAGPLFLDFFGGGIVNFNATLRPLGFALVDDLENLRRANGGDSDTLVGISDLSVDSGVGYGFLLGAGLGVQIDPVRIVLSATYRRLIHPLTLEGTYYTEAGGAAGFDTGDEESVLYAEDLQLLLEGIAIGINASFAM